jgi:hypothetical protein
VSSSFPRCKNCQIFYCIPAADKITVTIDHVACCSCCHSILISFSIKFWFGSNHRDVSFNIYFHPSNYLKTKANKCTYYCCSAPDSAVEQVNLLNRPTKHGVASALWTPDFLSANRQHNATLSIQILLVEYEILMISSTVNKILRGSSKF